MKINKINEVFVPEWGWVGSATIYRISNDKRSFRPRVGMGWFKSQSVVEGLVSDKVFVPEWGWVGSLPSHFIGWNNWVFVPEWGWVGS